MLVSAQMVANEGDVCPENELSLGLLRQRLTDMSIQTVQFPIDGEQEEELSVDSEFSGFGAEQIPRFVYDFLSL